MALTWLMNHRPGYQTDIACCNYSSLEVLSFYCASNISNGGGDQQSLWCYYPSTTAQHASVGKEKRELCIKTVAMKDIDMI